ncbi:cell division protein FtsQ/DivIB [Mycolicibacterium phocaicum]|uniref:Cell division protein FtsQ n=1 Tax=Mycolicibacterium phocaicum TaxID=319706 RepID=A0A7I7ZMW2_9MYCO|nr:FtsQ-type POTRA domain-containing protein [Mycolicibacterium phocaicum]TLH70475.1 cell division protein FtsQ [Mycolicibacterium phocaicum]BBZ54717.1 cell division protein FtsQ [Mycolicibacterium phocaicum]
MTGADGSGEPATEPVAAQDDPVQGETAEDVVPDSTAPDAAAESAAEEAPDAASADPASPDYEGPRRRARREREERRIALERARALEQARQEARRRAAGLSEQPKAPTRGVIRGLKMLLWSAVTAVVAVALGLVLYFTPIMAVRHTVVTGLGTLTEDQVTAAAAVKPETPLLQVNTDAVAERVATIRRVASARVQREYPSTLRITVLERVPVAAKEYPDGPHLFDRDGVDFATEPPPPGLPYLDADNPGPKDPATLAALEVLLSLRPEVFSQVARVGAPSVAGVTLTLNDGREVIWGTTDRTEEKALKLGALLTQPGHTYDVSSPDLPTVK